MSSLKLAAMAPATPSAVCASTRGLGRAGTGAGGMATAGGRKIASIDGNGALLLEPPNLSRPRTHRISACGRTRSWNQAVYVRDGTRQTTVAPLRLSAYAFAIQVFTSEYGGLHQQTPSQRCRSPSCSGLKYCAHSAFSFVAQTST